MLKYLFVNLKNPQADLQAQDRCHRIGQTKPVVVYRLITVNTIDEKILERASAKRKLEKMVIHKSKCFYCLFVFLTHELFVQEMVLERAQNKPVET